MGEGGNVRKYKLTPTYACAHKHKHKIKEERQSLEVASSRFPISATRDNTRPSVPTVGTLSGLQTNANTHTHTDARTPLQTHSSSEEPI